MLASNPYQPPSDGKCPINELPAEILGCIFKLGVEMEAEGEGEEEDGWEDISDEEDEDDDDDLNVGSVGSSESSVVSDDSCESPLFQILVSHVCRHWRDVVLNLHVLWTTIDFDHDLQLERAKVFINRAQGLPLNIHIDLDEDTDEENHPDHPLDTQDKETPKDDTCEPQPLLSLMHILDLIEPEVHHWGELNCQFSTYDLIQALLSRLHKLPSAPLLKQFNVYHFEEDCNEEFFSDDDKTIYLPFHGNAPLLESAVFWGVHIDWDNSLSFLQGLLEFELSYHANDVRPSYATFIQIIKNSPDLRSLILSRSGPTLSTESLFDDEAQWGPEPLEIPSVRYLTLQFHEPQYASALIQHFYFPNLRGLTLNFDEEDYTSFVRKLLVPVKGRSKSILSGLEKLKISGLPCDIATVEAMLKQLTELKVLDLKCFGSEELVFFKKLIDPLARRKKQEDAQNKAIASTLPKIFCPVLETLTISLVRDSQIKALVMARKAAGAPLKTLRLSYEDEISMKTKEWLRKRVEVVEFFEPSDSEDEMLVNVEENDGDDEDNDESSESEEYNDEDDDEEQSLEEFSSYVAHLRRRVGPSDLD